MTWTETWPASTMEISPAHMHMHIESLVSAGMPAMSTSGAPGAQGAVVTGTHGIGVCTPRAAAVAAITSGLVVELHMPKVGMLTIGAKCEMLAAGRSLAVTKVGGTEQLSGTGGPSPIVHWSMAPSTTCMGMAHSLPHDQAYLEVGGPGRYRPLPEGATERGFAECGFAVLPGLIGPEELASCRAALAERRVGRRQDAPGASAAAIIAVPPGSDPRLEAWAGAEHLLGLAGRLLGGAAVCFGITFIVKPALTGQVAEWHQDGRPWRERLGIDQAVTIWLALDDTDDSNGALCVIPGSHRRPLAAPDASSGGLFPGTALPPGSVDLSEAVVLRLAAGDASAHHSALVHGSGPNVSGRPRRALALRYRAL